MRKWLSWIITVLLVLSFMASPALAEDNQVAGNMPENDIVDEFPDEEFSKENMGTVELVENPGEAAGLLTEEDGVVYEAYIPQELEKTVFGRDDRVDIYASAYPYSAVANMVVKAQCGCSWSGTGFMISNNHMLTAAHCLVCTTHGKWAKNLTLYFGQSGPRKYVYKYNGKWYAWAGDTFSNNSYRSDWDYACVKLYKNVGDKTGWFGAAWNATDSSLNNKWVTLAGYRNQKLKAASGTITPSGNNHLVYTIDTEPGSSGGPIFDSNYYAYGINIASNQINNVGFRINSLVWDAYNETNKK